MKRLETSTFTFSKLIEGNCLYVDKTAIIFKHLVEPSFGQFFISRPRRFGKSLFISTLKEIFQGRRELFVGLAIDQADYDWKSYPVIHLDMGSTVGKDVEETESSIKDRLESVAKAYQIQLKRSTASAQFNELVESLYETHGKVVILVDEYDKPLLGHLGQTSVREIQSLLKSFYSVIKTTEPLQRFALLTGVSKFSKVSIFSDLNNLTDLTMSSDTATLLGYTQEELESNFLEYIEALAQTEGWDTTKTLEELKLWYNGYRFHGSAVTVYNPVSTMKCLGSREFKNYWFETGTPTFLVDLLKASPVDMDQLSAPEHAFSVYDVEHLAPLPLMFQTGYLTIKSSEKFGSEMYYELGYPNLEIEQSFSRFLAQGFGDVPLDDMSSSMIQIHRALAKNDIDTVLEELKIFFANVPYNITLKNEKYYQTIFFVVFKLLGTFVEAEVHTNRGRIDAVLQTKDHIFVMEFKLHGDAEQAMAQIHEKQYAQKYQGSDKCVTLVGVGFDPDTRNLSTWLLERL
jgi:hypothetical protein